MTKQEKKACLKRLTACCVVDNPQNVRNPFLTQALC